MIECMQNLAIRIDAPLVIIRSTGFGKNVQAERFQCKTHEHASNISE